MTYIHKAALKQIDRDIEDGFPYSLAVINAAIHWNISSFDLRAAHEQHAHREDLIHRASIAFLMFAVLVSPVLFHFAVKA
jgi:hypothetical protein